MAQALRLGEVGAGAVVVAVALADGGAGGPGGGEVGRQRDRAVEVRERLRGLPLLELHQRAAREGPPCTSDR